MWLTKKIKNTLLEVLHHPADIFCSLLLLISLGVLIFNYNVYLIEKSPEFETYIIEGVSMVPTFENGEKVLLDKRYVLDDLKRGDIIAVDLTNLVTNDDEKHIVIKRLIGLPEDEIEFKDNEIFINGILLEEDYLEDNFSYKNQKLVVPSKEIFILGDNRDNSVDSLDYGFVSRDTILGYVKKSIFVR